MSWDTDVKSSVSGGIPMHFIHTLRIFALFQFSHFPHSLPLPLPPLGNTEHGSHMYQTLEIRDVKSRAQHVGDRMSNRAAIMRGRNRILNRKSEGGTEEMKQVESTKHVCVRNSD